MAYVTSALEPHPWFTWTARQGVLVVEIDWEAVDAFWAATCYAAHKYWGWMSALLRAEFED